MQNEQELYKKINLYPKHTLYPYIKYVKMSILHSKSCFNQNTYA